MWPWEHLAVGYLLYSCWLRARRRSPPTHRSALVLAAATQFPDAVDKPLGWVFGVVPDGTSLAHSLFVALALVVIVGRAARASGRADVGEAFAIGYLSHLPADAIYPIALGDAPKFGFLLWPLVRAESTASTVNALPYVQRLFVAYLGRLTTPAGVGYLLVELALLAGALALWTLDERPGWPHEWRRRRPDG